MRTGEGKTLTATLPAYLHALAGAGVHVMTANDYLALTSAESQTPETPQTPQTSQVSERLGLGWEDLIKRVCRSPERPP